MIDENELEQEMVDKGLIVPRVTPAGIDSKILSKAFYRFPGSTVTVCLLTLVNGFSTLGESACASAENFDEEIGRKLAFENARSKVWPLEGYLLRDALHRQAQAEFDATLASVHAEQKQN